MPRRHHPLATNEIYHAFNRSVGREEIFVLRRKLKRMLELIDYYRFQQTIRYSIFKLLSEKRKQDYLSVIHRKQPLVEIYSFALMPNHYHLLLKQLEERGIFTFLSNIQNGFAKYFNLRNDRHGTLFSNAFKAKRVETEDEFIHISRYIHLNPVTAFLIEFAELSRYPWTSFSSYSGKSKSAFISHELILDLIGSKERHEQFVKDQVDYQRTLSRVRHLLLE